MRTIKKTRRRVTAICVILVVLTVLLVWRSSRDPAVEALTYRAELKSCVVKPQIERAVQEFSAKQRFREMEDARTRLMNSAKLSTTCREEVIGAVMKAMDKPQLDIYRDFNLWRYGSNLLGDLNATESLDLLIGNLNFTDGSSINVSHYPAMEGVIKIGRPAISKLGAALRQNSDTTYRYNAIFCIAQIGGPQATAELKTAISSESDPCVRNFIQVSIDVLNNPRSPGEINSEDRNKWFAALSCKP